MRNILVTFIVICVFVGILVATNMPSNYYTPPTETYAKFVHEYNSTEVTFCNEYGITEQAYVRDYKDHVLFCTIRPETCEVYNEPN